jgi:hypothetical protein
MSVKRLVGRLASAAAFAVSLGACSESSDNGAAAGSPSGTGGAPAAGSPGQTSSGGSNASGASTSTSGGGSVVVGISGATGAGGAATCAGETTSAKQVPLDIYLMLDSSGSMTEPTITSDKWNDVLSALGEFISDPGSEGIGLGLQYFPILDPSVPDACSTDADCGANNSCITSICLNVLLDADVALPCDEDADCNYDTSFEPTCGRIGDCPADGLLCLPDVPDTCTSECLPLTTCLRYSSCDVGVYATPAVPIAPLPASQVALRASLEAKMPDGKTPTAPALGGAIQHAQEWGASHPDHEVVVLLATDGLPTECLADPDSPAAAIAEVSSAAQAGLEEGVRTFVIGVFTPDDIRLGARDNLDQIATAGGTEHAYVVDSSQDVTAQFLEALSVIRGERLGCEFQVATSAQNDVDFDRVNVDFTSGATTTRVPRVADQGACDATRGGWYYDVDPSAGEPERIIVCPKSCADFGSAEDASVQIELGCLSEIIE